MPDLSSLDVNAETAVAELTDAYAGSARGGPEWDPFRGLPELRLSNAAQGQLLGVLAEAKAETEAAELKLSRARSDRGRGDASRRAYQMAGVSSWAQEALMASVSPLLVRRVDIALKRHHRDPQGSADEYMAEALACALACMHTCPVDAKFHLYVASSVDATLSNKSLEGSVGETMPQAWRIALRHLPSIIADLQHDLGRDPGDREVGEVLITRARAWAEARIVEKGGEVEPDILADLVDAKLTKQGMFSAIKHIGEIRAAASGVLSLDAETGESLLSAHAEAGADVAVEESMRGSTLRELLAPMPFVSPDLEVSPENAGRVRELLESELWRSLVTGPGIRVETARVERKVPDIIGRIAA